MFNGDPYSIRPMRDWVIIRHDARKIQLTSGILLVEETNAEKLHEAAGVIIRVGNGTKARALDLAPGNRVLYRTYLRHSLPIDSGELGTTFFFINVADIAAVLGQDVEVGALSERKSA